MQTILGQKKGQTQAFLTDGTRVPVTVVSVAANPVLSVKTADKNGYIAVQLGQGMKKHATKQEKGHATKGAKLDYAPYFVREVRMAADIQLPAVGDKVEVATVLEAGDIVDVQGTSKGKGFAGGVKRHNFKGGPRTHGQSDRERAPGSIGQTTTPGRVYRGKRMAGKMGNDTVTVRNLEVVDVTADGVLIKGLVPGIRGAYVVITKVGKNKKAVPMVKAEETKVVEASVEAVPVQEEKSAEEVQPEAKTESASAESTAKKEVKTEEKKEEVQA
jgi:large subunit ribosomal protein L3